LGEVGEKLTDPNAAPAMLGKLKRRSEDLPELIALAPDILARERFSIVLVKARLGIEQIHMTGSTPHEQENDAFRPGSEVRRYGRQHR